MEGRFRKAEFAREGGVQNQLLVHVIEAYAAAFHWANISPIISHHLPFTPRTRHWKCVKVSTIHSEVLEETKKSLNICPAAFQWYRVVGHKHELPKLPEETMRNLHRGYLLRLLLMLVPRWWCVRMVLKPSTSTPHKHLGILEARRKQLQTGKINQTLNRGADCADPATLEPEEQPPIQIVHTIWSPPAR